MDYLTVIGPLIVSLLAISLSFRLFDYLPTIGLCFWLFDSILAIWLSFGNLTVFRLFDYLRTIWLSFGLFDCFSNKLFDCLFGYLTVFREFDYIFGYLTVFREFDYIFGSLTVFWAIWLYFKQFNCLLVIQLSFGYLTTTRTTLESHLNYTRIALEWH